jgi:hypothetical protein
MSCGKFGENRTVMVCNVPLEAKLLAKLRMKALRCRVWLSSLTEIQRKFMNVVIITLDKVRSRFLAALLAPIVKALVNALEKTQDVMEEVLGKFTYSTLKNGRMLAHKISRIAQVWGNKSAFKWSKDEGFIRYLSIVNLHSADSLINWRFT